GRNQSTTAIYDAANRLVESFNALGEVARTFYDASGEVVMTIRYAKRIDPATGASAAALSAALGPDGLSDPRNLSNTALYDGAGRLTDVVGYATPIALTSLPVVPTPADVSALITSSVDDRHARSFYDAEDRRIGQLDAEGDFSEYQYNGAGELTHTISYAK